MTAVSWALGVLVVILAHGSHRALASAPTEPSETGTSTDNPPASPETGTDADPVQTTLGSLPTTALFVNVLFTQGGILLLVGLTVGILEIPPGWLGLAGGRPLIQAIGGGVLGGFVLFALDEGVSAAVRRMGLAPTEQIRDALTPTSRGSWVLLLGGILPLIAVSEEVLFRAAMVGVPASGMGVSLVALAIGSSLLFGFAHGIQGPGGVIVTGTLGLALVGVFVVTKSLLAAIIAHYIINALEFLVYEREETPHFR